MAHGVKPAEAALTNCLLHLNKLTHLMRKKKCSRSRSVALWIKIRLPCGSLVNTPPVAFSSFIKIIGVCVHSVVQAFPSRVFWLELMRQTRKAHSGLLFHIFFFFRFKMRRKPRCRASPSSSRWFARVINFKSLGCGTVWFFSLSGSRCIGLQFSSW